MAFLLVPITYRLFGRFLAAKRAANCMSSGRAQPEQLALCFSGKIAASA